MMYLAMALITNGFANGGLVDYAEPDAREGVKAVDRCHPDF